MFFMKPFKFFVYTQVYVIDCNVPNTEMAGSNWSIQNKNQNLTILLK